MHNGNKCENSECDSLTDVNPEAILKEDSKTLRQRYCLPCANIIREGNIRDGWKRELGIE